MKYLIELVADPKGLEPALTAMDELNAKEKELKTTTTQLSAEQKKMMDDYATKAKLGKDSIDKLTQGYKQLGKAATGAFGKDAINGATKAAESFRAQLRNSREEVTKLFVEGKATTAQIYEAARAGGALKDSIGDAQQAISVLASDTFKFDAAIQGVQLGAAGFQVLTAGAALFGEESEDLQKTLVKLNGIMALTQSLQQIVNLTQKQSAFSLGVNVAAQKAYTLVVGRSTGAMVAFRIALAAITGGFIIAGIIALIMNWDKLKASISGVNLQLEKNVDLAQKNLEAQESLSKEYELQEAQARLRGETEEKILNDKIKNAKTELSLIKLVKDATQEQTDAIKDSNEQRKIDSRNYANPLLLLASLFKSSTKDVKEQTDKQTEINNKYTEKLTEIVNTQVQLKDMAAEKAKKAAEQEAAMLDRLNEQYKKSLTQRRQLIAEAQKQIDDDAEKSSQDRLKSLREQQKKEEDIYIASLRRRRELEAEIQNGKDDFLKEQSQIRFERRRAEIEMEIKAEEEKEMSIKDASIQIAQQTADAIFQILNTNRNNEFNAQIQRLNELKDKELSNKELTDAQKARIEERYQRQIAAIKTKQAQAEKQAAIAQAIINGALAITKILASLGGALNPAAIASIVVTAASTAAQIAVIASTKIPKFAKGTEYVHGGGTETSDSVPAMLSRGERVIDAKTNKLLKGIPNKLIPDLLIPQHTMIKEGMDYDKLAKAFSKELSNNPALMVNFDKQGFTTFIKSGVTTSQIKNNRNGV